MHKKLVSNPLLEPPHDKTNKMTVRPAKTQISLGIRPVWSESSLCAHWVAKGPSFLHADSEDSDQTGRMPRLIWVFDGRNAIMLVLSRGGSFVFQTVAMVLNWPIKGWEKTTTKKTYNNLRLSQHPATRTC